MSVNDVVTCILLFWLFWRDDRVVKVKCKCSPPKKQEEDIDLDNIEIEQQDFNKQFYGLIDGKYILAIDQEHFSLVDSIVAVKGYATKPAALRELKQAVEYFTSIEEAVDQREYADFDELV